MDNSWSHTFQQTPGGLRGIMKRALKYLQDEMVWCPCAPPRLLNNLKSYFICFRALTGLKYFIFNPARNRFPYNIHWKRFLLLFFGVSVSHNGFMEKNKQFIKLYHKYIHNINEDILQIYSILQYTFPFRRESFRQQTVLF